MNGVIETDAPPAGKRYRVFGVVYPISVYQRLEALARRNDRTKSYYVRRAVERLLDEAEAKEAVGQ